MISLFGRVSHIKKNPANLFERYLSHEEDKVAHSVDGSHSERILHQDKESVTGRGAETGAVDGCGSVCILK